MQRGIVYAFSAAALFGLSTPLAKALLATVTPWMLAGLLYAGSGVGLLGLLAARTLVSSRAFVAVPTRVEWRSVVLAMLFGGIVGPVALMYGLRTTPAATTSLLLNLEAVFTSALAWFLFREHMNRRIVLGMLAIVAGGVVLAWPAHDEGGLAIGAWLIAGACLCWAIDNNLTRRASTADPMLIAGLKGAVAAIVNLCIALLLGQRLPDATISLCAMAVGFLGYGVSLALFVLALRHLGAARTSAYFSVAPFFGALAAVALQGDTVSVPLVAAAVLMAAGVWLHLTERHEHLHVHEALEHAHSHVHDEHHRHEHAFRWSGNEPHTHRHAHPRLAHSHRHYPDAHHRHRHGRSDR